LDRAHLLIESASEKEIAHHLKLYRFGDDVVDFLIDCTNRNDLDRWKVIESAFRAKTGNYPSTTSRSLFRFKIDYR